ncbi:MAG: CRISPR-associated endonuclease Cas1 [Candidatus Eremiobacteraeota bacterium]|nr:CRISPR-associated endonuclease Cas1 [Candidatus Eremiobacteraeota bacterium]
MIQLELESIPARIVNQYTYCPRLAYLEWVQKEWADNLYTQEGSWAHRVVDAGNGKIPDSEEPVRTRSLELAAPRLGLVGKLDMVELGRGEAEPVEYKRGRRPKSGEVAEDWDLMQLAAQALLLRENGWKCERGFFYFCESREKVSVELDDQLLARVEETLAEMRTRFEQPLAPEPLVASQKCGGCSLVGICLPDETWRLKQGAKPDKTRRLLAPKDDALPLYLTTNGLSVGINGELLEIREKGKAIDHKRFLDISHLCLMGNIQVSTQAVRHLSAQGIPICYFSYGGWFSAMTQGMSHRNVELRRAQYRAAFDPVACLGLARRFVSTKIRNGRTFLRRNNRSFPDSGLKELKRLALAAERAENLPTLLGLEGMAARIYFQALPGAVKNRAFLEGGGFDSGARNRRPPKDPMNALLSLAYSLLTKEMSVISHAIGFDPFQGFYHQSRYGKPALALDVMEEFRVLIADSVVLSVINNQMVTLSDFDCYQHGVVLNQAGRRALIGAFEKRMEEKVTHPWFDYRLTYRRILYVQLRLLARYLCGEIAEFPPFVTR